MSRQNVEIERKFLVKQIPAGFEKLNKFCIEQGYIYSNDSFEMRVRRKGADCFQTIKTGKGIQRMELEIEISELQFGKLWELTGGKRIIKDRYEYREQGLTYEIDIFHGSLEGLVIVEVEFPDREAAAVFQLPPWFDMEVTEDEQYKNKNLCINGIPQ